jgi:hypothetical protein
MRVIMAPASPRGFSLASLIKTSINIPRLFGSSEFKEEGTAVLEELSPDIALIFPIPYLY